MSNPWIKFYPRDWRGDQALRAVSIAARGLWMECLCIMHEAQPYGHLVLNGRPVEGGTLARMAGVSVDEVSTLMSELREAGVLSVTREGVVFSRRMVSDHARAQKGRKAIRKRWQQAPDMKEQSGEPNRSPNRIPITQKPEARSQKETRVNALDGFAEWYALYPNKVGRPAAEKAWPKARSKADQQTLMAGLRAYIASKPEDRPWCNPATWLNQERWADQPALPKVQQAWRPTNHDDLRAGRIKSWQQTGFWDASWGPQPEAA